MKSHKELREEPEVLSVSPQTKDKLARIAKSLKGRELFPEKLEQTRMAFRNMRIA